MDTKVFVRNVLGWGFALWFAGYVLGFALFAVVPTATIGWVIMPFGLAATWWVLAAKVRSPSVEDDMVVATLWTLMAAALDYVFIVVLLRPTASYYQADVLSYYALTYLMPFVVGSLGRWFGSGAGRDAGRGAHAH